MRGCVLILTAILTSQVALAAAPKSPYDKQYNAIRLDIVRKNWAEAVANAEQVLNQQDLSDQDRIRFLSIAATAHIGLGPDRYPIAKDYYQRIIDDPRADNLAKIQAFRDLADSYIKSCTGQYLDQMDLAPAHAFLDRALKLADLKPEEQAVALHNIGNLYHREDKDDAALDAYHRILTLELDERARRDAWSAIIDVHIKQATYAIDQQRDQVIAQAVSIAQQQGFDLAALYKRLAEFDKATTLLVKTLDDPQATDEQRWAAFSQLPCLAAANDGGRKDPPQFRAGLAELQRLGAKYLPGLMASDPNRALVLLRSFRATPVTPNIFYYQTNASPAYIAWAGKLLLEVTNFGRNDRGADYALVRTKHIDALAALHDTEQVILWARRAQDDDRLDAATRFWAGLVGLAFTGAATDAAAAVDADASLPRAERAQAALDAAKTALSADREDVARALYDAYQRIVPPRPTATVDCPFLAPAPNDVGSWLESPMVKGRKGAAKLDRPYGDNLKLVLETDSASGDRGVDASADAAGGDADTELYVACDAQGVHVFLDAHDAHAEEVQNGLLRGSSFESYLAPGKDQPYFFFMPRLPDGPVVAEPTSFVTMYPNAGWRLPTTADGTFRNDIRRTPTGFGISVFFAWELFYDKLPADGGRWQFESIRWTRAGGFSFGGSESVHNVSSFGEIVFHGLDPENLNAIKRTIVYRAAERYRATKKAQSPVSRWKDPELGDPAFYQARVAPLLARLDPYLEKVHKDMTAADVDTVFRAAVPDWMELEHRVAALRTRYLKEKYLTP